MSNEVSPDHYKWRGGPEPREVILDHRLSFYAGSVVKYIYRYPQKGRILDVEKAITCLKFLADAGFKGGKPEKPVKYWEEDLARLWGLNDLEYEIIASVIEYDNLGGVQCYTALGAAELLRDKLIADHKKRLTTMDSTESVTWVTRVAEAFAADENPETD